MMESNTHKRLFQRLLKTVLNPNTWHLVPIKKTVATDVTATGWGKMKQRLTFGDWHTREAKTFILTNLILNIYVYVSVFFVFQEQGWRDAQQ